MNGKFDFIGLGYCSNDYLCMVDEIPFDHKVETLDHLTQGGGPAATAAVTAARLGMKTAFVSVVGDDDSGPKIISGLKQEKINVSYMKVRANSTSSTAFCWIDKTGKRSIVWYRGNGKELTPEETPSEIIQGAKILHLDGHHTSAALAAAKIAQEHGVLVSIDAGTLRPGVADLLEYCDIVIASEFFAQRYAKTDDPEKALLKMVEIGAKVTGVTLGLKGSMCFDRTRGEIIRMPAFTSVNVVDTTGAGDVYHAAFAVRYSQTRSVIESMRFASGAAAMKCTKLGGRSGIPNMESLKEFLSNN